MKSFFLRVLAVALAAMPCVAGAKFRGPQLVPVERLLKAAEAYRAAHPAEAEAHYTLGRIHYLAFSRGTAAVPALDVADESGKPMIPGNWMIGFDLYAARQKRADELALKDVGVSGPKVPPEKASAFDEARGKRARQLEEQNWHPRGDLPAREMIAHGSGALASFREAQRLDPQNALYTLGVASLFEEFAGWAASARATDLPTPLRGITPESVRSLFLEAFRRAIEGDAPLSELPLSGVASLVSYEAGHAFVRLAERDSAKLQPAEKMALSEVRAGLKELKKIPLGAITPVVFSMRRASRLLPLLAPETRVEFDLRGYGPRQRWPWVQPTTAFLVWDPEGLGAITSARQLFGSYTFEIFRRTGYHALAALDADTDGTLRGDELRGIRAWFDRNHDGRTSPGEVRDLCDLSIIAIAASATAHDGPHPTNPHGLTLRDGVTLPTWDWIAHPLGD